MAPGKYNYVFTDFWHDTGDWPDDERLVAIYLLTCEHRSTEGLFQAPAGYVASDLGWEVPRVEEALEALQERGWLEVERGWVLLRNALRWQQPRGPKQIEGAVRQLVGAPHASPLWEHFLDGAYQWSNDLYIALQRRYPANRGGGAGVPQS
jgi:hypothetical protein